MNKLNTNDHLLKNAVSGSYNTEFVMKALCLIIWMVISLLFVCSIIGLVMFIPKDNWEHQDNTPSTWNSIGKKLLNSVV
jgi:hypothetical protein